MRAASFLLVLLANAVSGFTVPAAPRAAVGAPLLVPLRVAGRAPPVALQEGGGGGGFLSSLLPKKDDKAAVEEKEEKEEEGMTLEKVASYGIAGVLSIAVAETVFWVLSFPTSELLYFVSTGEWIDLLSQEGQLKFLAFTAGWGAIGGVIAQYRTVLTAAAMTPWMDRCAPPARHRNASHIDAAATPSSLVYTRSSFLAHRSIPFACHRVCHAGMSLNRTSIHS